MNVDVLFYVVSDCTGKTAKNLVESASGQYPDHKVEKKNFPFVRKKEKIDEIIEQAVKDKAIIVFTTVKEELRKYIIDESEKND
ncbi:MAG: kinase/pyrophosphorylase, partial [Halanaerobium sp. MSAO_Bac5]